ncbi:MAG: Cupin domain [Gammaproteobacteria bacterium]|jgi:mannose-6-phosphate isomerase-like protein (cupin superfamily)|nr:Cupin domain [Gammaproteobacteria bacterium]
MYIADKNSAAKVDTGYGEHVYKLANEEAGNLQKHSVVYVEIEPGRANKKHFHPEVEETYYILSGQAFFELENESTTLHPGQLVTIPIGKTHKIINPSADDRLCLLATCAMPWHKDCSIFLE